MTSIKHTLFMVFNILHSLALATFLGASPAHLVFYQDAVEGMKLFQVLKCYSNNASFRLFKRSLCTLDVLELSDNFMSLIMWCEIFPRLSNVHSIATLSIKMFPVDLHISLKDNTFENPYWWYTVLFVLIWTIKWDLLDKCFKLLKITLNWS